MSARGCSSPPGRDAEEAAAIVAAIERFARTPRAPPGARRAAAIAGCARRASRTPAARRERPSPWGEPTPGGDPDKY